MSQLYGKPIKGNSNVQKTILQSIPKPDSYTGEGNNFVEFDMWIWSLVQWMSIANLCGPDVRWSKSCKDPLFILPDNMLSDLTKIYHITAEASTVNDIMQAALSYSTLDKVDQPRNPSDPRNSPSSSSQTRNPNYQRDGKNNSKPNSRYYQLVDEKGKSSPRLFRIEEADNLTENSDGNISNKEESNQDSNMEPDPWGGSQWPSDAADHEYTTLQNEDSDGSE
ncbi:hypothetical protein K435DRAFT_801577 [Dendrothele bispora CBS 962.96]|uniref:Uncharacterized protein n=1 Tax=Dendrothele bispora (strain CBS 962.96) TaxID=1314807 RepID=A0A4S8LNU3_DENBC|nr:hypothetical protein K435DRAFT_801577 [Dendrothele bispora CBS 962.96]